MVNELAEVTLRWGDIEITLQKLESKTPNPEFTFDKTKDLATSNLSFSASLSFLPSVNPSLSETDVVLTLASSLLLFQSVSGPQWLSMASECQA